jgi:hypothetical protein
MQECVLTYDGGCPATTMFRKQLFLELRLRLVCRFGVEREDEETNSILSERLLQVPSEPGTPG